MKTLITLLAVLSLSGCSFFEKEPVLIETPVAATEPVINPAYPADKASQDAAFAKDATECNALAVSGGINPKDCLTQKGWPGIQ